MINPGRDILDGTRRVLVDSVPADDEGSATRALLRRTFSWWPKELDVELAVIKAVVSIEAGKGNIEKGLFGLGDTGCELRPKMYTRFKNKSSVSRSQGGESAGRAFRPRFEGMDPVGQCPAKAMLRGKHGHILGNVSDGRIQLQAVWLRDSG